MANDLTSSLAGLTLLGGSTSDLLTTVGTVTVQSRAARLAQAQFTLPTVTPPWKASTGTLPESVTAVQNLRSIVDPVQNSASLPPDLQSSFTAYKALDRLRVLAEFATRSTTSAAERSKLQTSFAAGVADLQRYLAVAPSDKLDLAFGPPKSRLDSIALPAANRTTIDGAAVGTDRYAAIPGLSGSERLTLKLSRPGSSDALTVDLSQTPQPPTLDSVAGALNAAIAAVPMRQTDGTPVLDTSGNAVPSWATKFAVVKGDKGWGLELQTVGIEQVSLSDADAHDGLMVAASQSVLGTPSGVALTRFDLPDSTLDRATIGALGATDRLATAEAQLLPARKSADGSPVTVSPVPAAITAAASISDTQGFTYVVGTTKGDSGTQRGDGADDLLLTKVDSRGTVIWQRSLGSGGSAQGTALSLAPDGDVVVAGTATGDVDGASTDGDLFVTRFSAAGEEKFTAPIRSAGADRATAVSVGADGSIIVGGKAADGTAMLARLDATGKLIDRQQLGEAGSEVRGLAAAPDGSSLVLLSGAGGASLVRLGGSSLTQTVQVSLGAFDPTSLAIAADGRVAVGGDVLAGDRNGQVIQLDPDLTVSATTSLASAGDDRVDSLAFLDGTLYAGGRTSGALGAPKAGSTDGFVARIAGDGSLAQLSQWGRSGTETGPVQVSAANGIDSAADALGFRSGLLNPPDSVTLVDRTALRAGDKFSFRVDGGTAQTVTITAGDTMATLAARMTRLAGTNVKITTARDGDSTLLRIEAKAGHAIDVSAGPSGHDALAKLGLEPGRLVAPPAFNAKAPKVSPGGIYGLGLSAALSVRDSALAAASLTQITTAISTVQAAYRSLYWDSSKAALADGSKGSGSVSAYQSAQLARYSDALARLTGSSS